MYKTTVNVVKPNGTMVTRIVLPVLIWLFVSTMTFPLVIASPESLAIITVPIMLIALISFIPVTIFLIVRGMKISKQHTSQKTVIFSVKDKKLFMDNQEVKVMKNPVGQRVDITSYNTTDVFYIEMDKADDFLQFLSDNKVL